MPVMVSRVYECSKHPKYTGTYAPKKCLSCKEVFKMAKLKETDPAPLLTKSDGSAIIMSTLVQKVV